MDDKLSLISDIKSFLDNSQSKLKQLYFNTKMVFKNNMGHSTNFHPFMSSIKIQIQIRLKRCIGPLWKNKSAVVENFKVKLYSYEENQHLNFKIENIEILKKIWRILQFESSSLKYIELCQLFKSNYSGSIPFLFKSLKVGGIFSEKRIENIKDFGILSLNYAGVLELDSWTVKNKDPRSISKLEYEMNKKQRIMDGFACPLSISNTLALNLSHFSIMDQEKLKYHLIVSSGFENHPLESSTALCMKKLVIRTKIKGIGFSMVKAKFYLTNWQSFMSDNHNILERSSKINYTYKDTFDLSIRERICDLMKYFLAIKGLSLTKRKPKKIKTIFIGDKGISLANLSMFSEEPKSPKNNPFGSSGLIASTKFVNKMKTIPKKQIPSNKKEQIRRLDFLSKDETLLLKLEIYPTDKKFNNHKIILNTNDIKRLFQIQEFIEHSYQKSTYDIGFISQIRSSNPRIQTSNLCHYLCSKLNIQLKIPYRSLYFEKRVKNGKLKLQNKFVSIGSKPSSLLVPFLTVINPYERIRHHKIIFMDGKYCVQSIVCNSITKKFNFLNYFPKVCLTFAAEIKQKVFKKIISRFVINIIKMALKIPINQLPKNIKSLDINLKKSKEFFKRYEELNIHQMTLISDSQKLQNLNSKAKSLRSVSFLQDEVPSIQDDIDSLTDKHQSSIRRPLRRRSKASFSMSKIIILFLTFRHLDHKQSYEHIK